MLLTELLNVNIEFRELLLQLDEQYVIPNRAALDKEMETLLTLAKLEYAQTS